VDGITEIALTKIVVLNARNQEVLVLQTPPVTAAGLSALSTSSPQEYTIIYHTKSPTNEKEATATRIVTVSPPVGSLPTPVIVLNTYRHTLPGGQVINHPDTAFPSGAGAAERYREKGVQRAYYLDSNGDTVNITLDKVTITAPSAMILNSANPIQTTVRYTIAAGSGYGAAEVTRRLTTYSIACDDETPPEISFADGSGDQLALKAGQPWNHSASWRASARDDLVTVGAKQYLIYLDGMDANNPKAGTYNIVYVAIGGCGGISVRPRTVTVTQ
jgi:hypothetical protein